MNLNKSIELRVVEQVNIAKKVTIGNANCGPINYEHINS